MGRNTLKRGQWIGFDRVLMMLNSLDTEGLTAYQMRRKIYNLVADMRPE